MGIAGPWYERLPHLKMNFTPSSGQRIADRVLRSPRARLRGDPRRRKTARPDHAAFVYHRASHHRRRPSLDEHRIQARFPRHPLHVEARDGYGEAHPAPDRGETEAIRGRARTGPSCSPCHPRRCKRSTSASPTSKPFSSSMIPAGNIRNAFLERKLYATERPTSPHAIDRTRKWSGNGGIQEEKERVFDSHFCIARVCLQRSRRTDPGNWATGAARCLHACAP